VGAGLWLPCGEVTGTSTSEGRATRQVRRRERELTGVASWCEGGEEAVVGGVSAAVVASANGGEPGHSYSLREGRRVISSW
jgi:hypothetical protein